MAKTKAEKITGIEEEIRQLENKKKRLIQEQKEQERRDRTNRLCKRMGLFEKLLLDTIPMTEEQFQTFLEQTVLTEHSRRILERIDRPERRHSPHTGRRSGGTGNAPSATKSAHIAQAGAQRKDSVHQAGQFRVVCYAWMERGRDAE